MAFVVNAEVPFRTTREMIAALKADPGKYSYASPGIGTLQHLAFEQFRRSAGVDALHVPYKGAAAMMPDLMGGLVEYHVPAVKVCEAICGPLPAPVDGCAELAKLPTSHGKGKA